jgi:hypothetical protein
LDCRDYWKGNKRRQRKKIEDIKLI